MTSEKLLPVPCIDAEGDWGIVAQFLREAYSPQRNGTDLHRSAGCLVLAQVESPLLIIVPSPDAPMLPGLAPQALEGLPDGYGSPLVGTRTSPATCASPKGNP
jgi:hypothetical protein